MSEETSDAVTPYRRQVMKAIGAGSAVTAVGGSAAARSAEGDGEGTDDQGEGSDSGGGDGAGTVHEVETLISGPPTNPDRPADFYYQPTGLHVEPGDVVRWRFVTPDHNVVSFHPAFGMRRRVPTGVDAFSSPILGWRPDSIPGDQIEPPSEMESGGDGDSSGSGDQSGDGESGDHSHGSTSDGDGPVPATWLYSFEEPGVYDLICSPHETYGMAMRVVVGDETDPEFETSDPEALPEPRRGPVGLSRVTLTDPALEPSAIVEQGTVAWEDLEANQTNGSDNGSGESGGSDGDGSDQ